MEHEEIKKKHPPRRLARLEREDFGPEDFAEMATKARRELSRPHAARAARRALRAER